MHNTVNGCVTIGVLENITFKTTRLHTYILFDCKQGVNSATHLAINKPLFFVVFSCETSKRKTVLSWAVWCDIVKQFREYMSIMAQDVRVNGGSFCEISISSQVRIYVHTSGLVPFIKTRFTQKQHRGG